MAERPAGDVAQGELAPASACPARAHLTCMSPSTGLSRCTPCVQALARSRLGASPLPDGESFIPNPSLTSLKSSTPYVSVAKREQKPCPLCVPMAGPDHPGPSSGRLPVLDPGARAVRRFSSLLLLSILRLRACHSSSCGRLLPNSCLSTSRSILVARSATCKPCSRLWCLAAP